MFMKMQSKMTTLLLAIILILFIFYIYENIISVKNNQTVSTARDNNLVIKEELRDVNFCGRDYKMKQVFVGKNDVLYRISVITNFNYKNDLFPKPDSNDAIYKDMTSIESKNIRYSFRPNALVKNMCSQFETSYLNKDIPIRNMTKIESGYTFLLGEVLISIENTSNFNSFYLDINPSDPSGMGGSVKIGI